MIRQRWLSSSRSAISWALSILPPDINEAGSEFRSTCQRHSLCDDSDPGRRRWRRCPHHRRARSKMGPFQSLYEFLKRLGPKRVGKKNVELLIDAGAFDSLGHTRDAHREVLDSLCDAVLRREKDSEVGIISLFSTQEQSESESLHTPTSGQSDDAPVPAPPTGKRTPRLLSHGPHPSTTTPICSKLSKTTLLNRFSNHKRGPLPRPV